MRIDFVTVFKGQKQRGAPVGLMMADYLGRVGKYTPGTLLTFGSEQKVIDHLDKSSGRTKPALILADSLGQQVSSTELAEAVRRFRDSGRQQLVFAVGPADGWSEAMRERAELVVAFGRITLPHELAAVVLVEQVYRALTILAGHPYHSGH